MSICGDLCSTFAQLFRSNAISVFLLFLPKFVLLMKVMKILSLTVLSMPKFTLFIFTLFICVLGHPFVFPLLKSVKEGENATLTCSATGVPGQNITWKRETGQQIINDNKYEIIFSGSGTSQLTVTDISINDRGYYVCDTSAIVNQPSSAIVNQPSSARGFLGVECKFCALILGQVFVVLVNAKEEIMKAISIFFFFLLHVNSAKPVLRGHSTCI